ncbi:hypothetical protein N7476_001405 [Penicillium atrosanguineum]|uniref:Uncharacterized protein n=1 Tax=Penicillium atrosanguineum TaxID=1132637 RepID=A0A9W9UCK6_9EURO|nr:hypothetical protein N7526_000421 [Penicillium atrosanguineum]KAJ5331622.1 hypothetical protein N7476_001405 [Penicillium atrosanguineum]
MASSDPNQPDPRIVRIAPDRHDTTESAESLVPSNLSENEPRWVWKFGNLVFNRVRNNPSEPEDGLESRIFGGPDARDMDYKADSESVWDLESSPSKTFARLSNLEHTLSTPSHSSVSTMGSVMPGYVRHLRIETEDETNDSGVECSDVASSESLVPTSVATSEDLEDTETIELRENYETELMFKWTLTDLIRQMMFVSGETAEPSIESTTLIEDITRQQVIEILTRSTALATRRGSRSISTDDLIFLIRHDKAKVSRLRTFLSWKDVRKNVKDSDDKGGGDAADFAAADDAAGVVAGPQDVAAKPKNKRAKVGLAWDPNSFFSIQVPEREDEEDEEEEEQNYATLQRLAAADERTRHMTKEEYVFWSECRQASFTYRKSKRFREWAGFGIVTESKPNDDIVDILGFLTFEIVQTLTEEALKVKEREDHEKNRGGPDAGDSAKKRKRETGLFDPPEEGRTPIEPRHIREAYRKLQATPQKSVAMLLHNARIPARLPLRLI